MDGEEEHESLSGAERRLLGHLEVVDSSALEPRRGLAGRVVRRARWQAALRSPLRLIGNLAQALVDGGRALGSRPKGPHA